jgi:hypothetical protein
MEIVSTTLALQNASAFVAAAQSFILQVAGSVIAICAVIAKFLPPPKEPGVLATIHGWVNKLGMNSGYAENAINPTVPEAKV